MDIFEVFAEETSSSRAREWFEGVSVRTVGCRGYDREYYRRNWHRIRETQRRYYQRHRAERNAKGLEWQRKNRERVNEQKRRRRAANPGPARACYSAWAKKNRSHLNAYKRRRRAMGLAA